ncbi:MAG: hypothetical protein LUC88_09915 [Prevotella sp.]|nr:hypothetical protein [Prevotella sp.]
MKSRVGPTAFNEKEDDLYIIVNKLSSQEIRNIIGFSDYTELCVAAEKDRRNISQFIKFLLEKAIQENRSIIASSDVTFKSSKLIPFNRWYPYIEGYSPEFVKTLIKKYISKKCKIYDPFAGTGTTIFASDALGYSSYYSEINPLLQFLIKTKLDVLRLLQDERKSIGDKLLVMRNRQIQSNLKTDVELDANYKKVFKSSIYFSDDNYNEILRVKSFLNAEPDSLTKDIFTIAVLACLIPASYLKKQGDLRFKTKKELEKGVPDFSDLLNTKLNEINNDLKYESVDNVRYSHTLLHANAKCIDKVTCDKIGCVITSPPYLNGTNYIRNTKLELWFLGYLRTASDLRMFRDEILTSGINDVKLTNFLDIDIESKSMQLSKTLIALKETAYDMRIPQMAKCYFSEMYQIFNALRPKLEKGANLLIDIGDSVFNGVHIRTDDILIEILESIGYNFIEKKKLRERRSRGGKIVEQVLIVMTNE